VVNIVFSADHTQLPVEQLSSNQLQQLMQ